MPIALPGAFLEGLGGSQRLSLGAVRTLAFGRLHGRLLPIFVVKLGPDRHTAATDGLLGMDAMAPYDIDIDPIGYDLTLYHPAASCKNPAVVISGPLYALPLVTQSNDRRAFIDVSLNGHILHALLDSGADSTAMPVASATLAGLKIPGHTATNRSYGTGIGPLRFQTDDYVLSAITFGDFEIDRMRIKILDTPGNALHADMVLGADFFHRFHVWISHSSHTIILQYPPSPSPPLTDKQKQAQAKAG